MSGHSIIEVVWVKFALHCLPVFTEAWEKPKNKSEFSSKTFPFRGENVTNLDCKDIDKNLSSPSKPDVLTHKAKKQGSETFFKTYILFSHPFEEMIWDKLKSPSYTNIASTSCW